MVVARDIPFNSLCMHHMLPFKGVAHVAYMPDEPSSASPSSPGWSSCSPGRLQIQEALTTQIANCLQENLAPKGVGVVLEAEHMCMTLRGVRSPGHDDSHLGPAGQDA